MPSQKPPSQPASHDWSQFIIQHAPAGVITMDGQGRVTDFNPAAEEITGFSREEALGKKAREVLPCEGGAHETCPVRLAMAGQEVSPQEVVLKKPGGQRVPLMISSFALKDERGVPLGGVIIFRDLTPVKRLEGERRQLVNMFAHDLKTPVVGMGGLVRRLRQGKAGPLTQAQRTYLDTIDKEMKRLEELITDFLEFARLDLRMLTPMTSAIQAEKECQEVLTLLQPLAEAKDIRLTAAFPQEMVVLQADPLLFRRVLENLLENAVKYSPPHTTVTLEVRAGEGEVRFAVKDQGPGIPSRDLPHLFEFFYRGAAAGQERGFGLGLATVKRIIDAHGGRIWVDSAPGKGTTFYFTFPS
jgi:two-component system phosphate regulon sensor histidine kinase PhoR